MENVSEEKHEKPNLKGDRLNIVLLIFMYVLQCSPRALGNAIALILQNKKVTYEEQVSIYNFHRNRIAVV